MKKYLSNIKAACLELLTRRNVVLIGYSLLVIIFLRWSDPNQGALTAALGAQLATPIIAVLFAHIARKGLFDYAKMERLYNRASDSAIGAAIIFASICAVLFGLLGLFGQQVRAADVNTYIPVQAVNYLPILRSEQAAYWSVHPKPGI